MMLLSRFEETCRGAVYRGLQGPDQLIDKI